MIGNNRNKGSWFLFLKGMFAVILLIVAVAVPVAAKIAAGGDLEILDGVGFILLMGIIFVPHRLVWWLAFWGIFIFDLFINREVFSDLVIIGPWAVITCVAVSALVYLGVWYFFCPPSLPKPHPSVDLKTVIETV